MSVENRNSRIVRHRRIRTKVSGTETRPRLSVFRSNTAVYAQVINDSLGKTIAAASTKEVSKGSVMDKSLALGKIIAEKAVKSGVKQVVFDRGGFKYAGKVAAVARGAREAGLSF